MGGYLASSRPGQQTTHSTQEVSIGTKYYDGNTNKCYRYAEAGGTNLDRGKFTVAATIVANHDNLSWATAPSAGDSQVKVTLGATAASLNDYKDGELVVQDGTGEGRSHTIEGHPAADASGTITVDLKEPIDTAGAASESNVDLIKNLYKDIVISVTDQADPVVGVPTRPITADQFNWVQTWGPCAVWFDEAVTAGATVTLGTSVAGSLELLDAAGEPSIGIVGAAAGVDDEYQMVYLRLGM